jgi:hypothetical protein
VARWRAWIENLVDPKQLARVCARLHPDGVPVPIPAGGGAAVNLALFEHWALIVALRGLRLPGEAADPGWMRILADQLDRFGSVWRLTRFSPPLRMVPPPD